MIALSVYDEEQMNNIVEMNANMAINKDESMLRTNGKYQGRSDNLSPSSSSGWVQLVFAGQHPTDCCRRWKAQPDC